MKSSPANIKELSNHLFWDVDIDTLDLKKHKSFIMERVFNYGQLKDFKLIFKLYESRDIQKEIIHLKNLSSKSLHFLSFYFSIPKEQFKCYILKQLKDQHWNF